MKCGVRFCGGCNPRFDRGAVYERIKNKLAGKVEFFIAEEGVPYDVILVIGGCTNCCASYLQFEADGVIKIWDEEHEDDMVEFLLNKC
ncbi:hypothetical protein [Clostridium aminobutyricum]|uniref:Uncharacterized protein n=1 Tax=Clostridium aminobutyricum TaxID=33953 RepID=A0A939D7C6_CLOAM|nr:hypothetical protein [Clostridium aminobutyricum]MBN7772163.1 hypothetical protein [Clostridium aminobutyricum]